MKQSITKITKEGILYYCNKCKKYLPESKFNIDNTNLHGKRGNLCRECKDCQRKRYYQERQRLLEDNYAALRYKLQQALKAAKRRAKENNKYIDIDLEYLFYLWNIQNGRCALTGDQMTYEFYKGRVNSNLSIDRIDSSKGYSKDNVQLVCMVANQMKNDLSINELLVLCNKIIQNNKNKED